MLNTSISSSKGKTMKVKSLFAATVLAAAAAGPAMAENFSYDYIQAAYSTGDVKVSGSTVDTSGVGFSTSFSINDSFHIMAGVANQDLEYGSLNADVDSFNVGIGARTSISSTTDLTGSVSYISNETTVMGFVDKATGYGVDLGVRHKLSDTLELLAGVGYTSVGSPKIGTTSVSFGGRYKLDKNFSIGAGYSFATNNGADGKNFLVAARFEF